MRALKPNIFSVGAIDWDARLFDRLIPLPDGTSYNSYLIKGSEKTALLDTVDPTMTQTLLSNLDKLATGVDYIVSHHAEQDHSGSIPEILALYPQAKVVTNPKCKDMLSNLLPLDENRVITIEDGGELSLGDKTLRFIYLPWVHWPETMGTYLIEDNILFSCDCFGAHLACSSLFVDSDEHAVYEPAKRYYAEIMMPFRNQIKRHLDKLAPLQIDLIAPSHGPIYNRPKFILEAYKDWTSDQVKNEVILPYVSMHGSTAAMVAHFVDALIERDITVRQFELSTIDIGKLAIALVDAATVVIGTPTVLTGPHPTAAYAAFLANALRPKTKFLSVISSYSWGSKVIEQITAMMTNLKTEIIEPVLIKGYPKAEDFARLDKLADEILAKHKAIGITN
jgi:flavorubredoxin